MTFKFTAIFNRKYSTIRKKCISESERFQFQCCYDISSKDTTIFRPLLQRSSRGQFYICISEEGERKPDLYFGRSVSREIINIKAFKLLLKIRMHTILQIKQSINVNMI